MISRSSIEEKRQYAQSYFEKGEQRRIEAARALKDRKAPDIAETAKTVRLRALRLAKDAAEVEAARMKAEGIAQMSTVIAVSCESPGQKGARRKKMTDKV